MQDGQRLLVTIFDAVCLVAGPVGSHLRRLWRLLEAQKQTTLKISFAYAKVTTFSVE